MKFGIAIFPTDYAIPMTELGPATEQRGFESLWVAEHSHIPLSHKAGPTGGELSRQYWHTLDPFVALASAASATTTLKIGTGISLVIEHDTIDLAKSVASIDHVSGGRFLFGVGGGWNRGEMADHGTAFESRWTLMRERIEAMKAIWTQDEAEYHGRFVDFGPLLCWPKPIQKPHPPVLLGGNGPRTLKRVISYGDGWMPNRGDYLARIPELQEMARAAGRGPIPVTAYGTRGDAAEIERFLEAGVQRAIYYLPADGRDAALKRLDEVARLTDAYR